MLPILVTYSCHLFFSSIVHRSHAILTLHVESRVPSGTGGLALSGTSPLNCEGTAWSPGGESERFYFSFIFIFIFITIIKRHVLFLPLTLYIVLSRSEPNSSLGDFLEMRLTNVVINVVLSGYFLYKNLMLLFSCDFDNTSCPSITSLNSLLSCRQHLCSPAF